MHTLRKAAIGAFAMAIGLATAFAPGEASAAFRPGGGGGGHFGGGMFHGGAAPFGGNVFHGGAMPAFHGGATPAFRGGSVFHSAGAFPGAFSDGAPAGQTRSANPAFAGGERHAFAFDRGRRDFDFRHRHRHFFFAGGPFIGFDYGYYGDYGYDCGPYWNGYRWVYPYGYGYACGYGS
jgi:hypothetical protein